MTIPNNPLNWAQVQADPAISAAGLAVYFATCFSRREKQILTCCTQDCSNQEVADKLGISVSTVKVHKRSIAKKMDIKGQVEFRKFLVWVQPFL